MNDNENTRGASWLQDPYPSTDDLLYTLNVMIHKAEREPETADAAIMHAMRIFDRIVERMA